MQPITHFYTISANEASAAIKNMGASSEGEPFWAFGQNVSQYVPMYRMVHPNKGTHLFTTFIDERDAAINEEGYHGEGIAFWCMPASTSLGSNLEQLFRLYNPQLDDHLYTINPHESAPDYKEEGVACCVFSSSFNGLVPLFRLKSPQKFHFYTVDSNERQQLLHQNYVDEGICGYVSAKVAGGGPQPFYRSYNPVTGGHLYTLSIDEHDAVSKLYGFRGDGISCYIIPDGEQSPGLLKLFRTYNKNIDDHFYTTDLSEFNHAITALGYVDEGIAGWVISSSNGKYTPSAAPVHRLSGDFSENFLLFNSAQPSFLKGNSNFL